MSDDKHGALFNCEDERISLRQLKRFEARAKLLNCSLGVTEEGSPGMRFINLLHRARGGSLLRAWRQDIDVRGTGRVAYVDFSSACRRLGVVKEGRAIWDSIRRDRLSSTPLEFHELAPDEANNLETFTTILWSTVGLDLEQAWMFMDVNNQNVLRYDDFERGARTLGFNGDVRLLFNGLDTSALGQVWRDEFDYLGRISRTAKLRLRRNGNQPGCNELISWVQRELGGAQVLIVKLGLSPTCRQITVSDLAARLTALGFPGDALSVAVRAARFEGGTSVSAEALHAMLSGGRIHRAGCKAQDDSSLKSPRRRPAASRSASTSRLVAKQVWKDGIDDFSDRNIGVGSHNRCYFSAPIKKDSASERDAYNPRERLGTGLGRTMSPDKTRVLIDHRASTRNATTARAGWATAPTKPAWDGTLCLDQERNLEMPPACRGYFSKTSPLLRRGSPDSSRSTSPTKKTGAAISQYTPGVGIHVPGYESDGSDDGVVLIN